VSQFVLALGVITVISGLYLWFNPGKFDLLIDKVLRSRWLYGAALLRFLLGAALIAAAPSVQYSQAVSLLGWLFAFAGMLLVTLPPSVVLALADRLGRAPVWQMRMWLSVSIVLGSSLAYAALA
jgi:hypothetical protein